MNDLSPIQALFLARLARKGDGQARAAVAAGEYTVEPFTITVSGNLTVGEDEGYTPTVKVPLIPTLVVALHRAGVQREGIAQIILDAASTAITRGGKVGDELEATIDYVDAEVKALRARLRRELPEDKRDGKVRVVGTIR